MTFTQIVAKIANRLNLTSATALTRIGEEVNERYREVCSGVGLQTSIRTTAAASTTVGNRFLTFTCEKVFNVFNNYGKPVVSISRTGSVATATVTAHGYTTGAFVVIEGADQTEYNGGFSITVINANTFTYPVSGAPVTPATGTITVQLQQTQWILAERTPDELRSWPIQADPPQNYAIYNMGATSVTIMLDTIPASVYILNADVEVNLTDLSGSQVPPFPQDFHDLLIWGGMADELYKMEKYDLSGIQEGKFEKRLSELRLFIAKSNALDIFQGRDRVNGFWLGGNGLVQ